MEDGQLPTEALVKTPYLSETLQLPADKGQVLQHLELMFALTVKVPEFLDESVPSFCPTSARLPTLPNSGYSLRMGTWMSPSKSTPKCSSALSSAHSVLHTENC